MKYFLKSALKTSINYFIVLVIFLIFLYTFIAIAGDNFTKWLPVYSALNFLFLFFILYTDYKLLAVKEKRPQYEIKSYPLKGVFLGLVGSIPIVAIFIVLSAFKTENELLARLIELAIDGILGPLYFIIRAIGGTPAAYAVAIFTVPAIVTLGYLAGYYNFSLRQALGRKNDTNLKVDKAFKPSPWNPSVEQKPKKKQRYGK